jgi:hypothetical protein
VLIDLLGDEQEFALTDPNIPGFVRHYTHVSEAIQDTIDGRVWAGIHYRWSDVNGLRVGKQIAEDVHTRLMTPIAP